MFKYHLSKILMKIWALFLSAGVLAILMGLRGWFILYDMKRLNPILTKGDVLNLSIVTIIIGVVAIVICVFTRKYITQMRVKGLESARFDEYGRLKGQDDYYELSLEAQRKMDEERRRKINAILPISEVKQLTHKGSENPTKDMDNLVGLEDVKEKMEEMVAQMEFETKHKMERRNSSNHMNMYGPPGTGKTTAARIMAGFLKEYGYIKRNEVIEVNGTFLTGADSAVKAEGLCQHAYGAVLFIDEAYSMTESQDGQEAIATLLKEMEDAKDKLVLIFAGYEDEMKIFLNSNPGLLSRIKDHFYFKSYSLDKLEEIFVKMAKEAGYELTDNAIIKVRSILADLKNDKNFGNARTCRNILDKTITKHALHVKRQTATSDFVLDENDVSYNNSI